MAKAVGQFTIIDLNDTTISSTAPAVKIVDMIWLDTSVVPNQLKKWSGTAWINVGDRNADININSRNLLLQSGIAKSGTSYLLGTWTLAEDFITGTKYTIILEGTKAASQYFGAWMNGGSSSVGTIANITGTNLYKLTFTAIAPTTGNERKISMYNPPSSTNAWTLKWIAMYKGADKIPLDWTPAPEDIDKKFESYSTTTQMNSAITVAKNEINLSVDQKVTTTYYQETAPTTPKKGEFWYKLEKNNYIVDNMSMTVNSLIGVTTSELTTNNKLYRYSGTAWQLVEDSALGDVKSSVTGISIQVNDITAKVETAEGSITEIRMTTDEIAMAVNASKLIFDETGLTIKNGGFKILGANDEILLSSVNGNLELSAYLKTGNDVGAVYIDKDGIYFRNTSGYGSTIKGGASLDLSADAFVSIDGGMSVSIKGGTSISLRATVVSVNGDLSVSTLKGRSCSWKGWSSLSSFDSVLTAGF